MPQFVKLPDPVHAQLKALAAARSSTMVEVIASFLRQAVEAGEIKPETSGLSVNVGLLLDLDASERDQGPFITVTTPEGSLPHMTREDAETVAGFLLGEDVAPDAARHVRTNAGKRWSVEARGTSLVLTGTPAGKGAQSVAFVMAPVVARDLAGQMRKAAQSAA